MSRSVRCSRCELDKPGLDLLVLPGPIGEAIAKETCSECWNLWRETEVRIINELRLNFIDPEAQRVLERHLCEFLKLSVDDDFGP